MLTHSLPRIAVPMPHSSDPEYAERSIPQYEHAVKLAGGEPVRIPLDRTPAEMMKIIEHCDGILLPGSKADVDPAKFRRIAIPAYRRRRSASRYRRQTSSARCIQDA